LQLRLAALWHRARRELPPGRLAARLALSRQHRIARPEIDVAKVLRVRVLRLGGKEGIMDNISPAGMPMASPDAVLLKVQHLLQKILQLESTAALLPGARLQEDLNIDSLGMVDVVLGVEEEFGVKIGSDIDLFDRIVTVGDAVNLILEKSAARPA
jgi:acyl carrier protein